MLLLLGRVLQKERTNKTIEYVFGAGGQEDRDIYLKEQAHPTMGTGSSEIDRAGSAG